MRDHSTLTWTLATFGGKMHRLHRTFPLTWVNRCLQRHKSSLWSESMALYLTIKVRASQYFGRWFKMTKWWLRGRTLEHDPYFDIIAGDYYHVISIELDLELDLDIEIDLTQFKYEPVNVLPSHPAVCVHSPLVWQTLGWCIILLPYPKSHLK